MRLTGAKLVLKNGKYVLEPIYKPIDELAERRKKKKVNEGKEVIIVDTDGNYKGKAPSHATPDFFVE